MQCTDSETDLIRDCLAGDRTAWEALIHRYRRLLYSIPLRRGLSEDDAADVFQNVCVKLYQNLHQLQNSDGLMRWLITTTTRESWRVLKQSRRHEPLLEPGPDQQGDSPLETLPATDPLPHEVVIRLEEEQKVRQAIEQLGERSRELLQLLYWTHPAPSYAEIARRMGIPEGSIGPTRARCLQGLRKILESEGR
jgi:RNA polymerase sigma factor (sigma-70 family)